MLSKENLIKIWQKKGQILEGIMNKVFKKEHVEAVAHERMEICKACDNFTLEDDGCVVPGSGPCCDQRKTRGCGCSLELKTRALSDECPLKKWEAVMSEDEEDKLKDQLK